MAQPTIAVELVCDRDNFACPFGSGITWKANGDVQQAPASMRDIYRKHSDVFRVVGDESPVAAPAEAPPPPAGNQAKLPKYALEADGETFVLDQMDVHEQRDFAKRFGIAVDGRIKDPERLAAAIYAEATADAAK